MSENDKPLSSDEKALEISEQPLSPNHPDSAMPYNNIVIVRDNMGEYSKALYLTKKHLKLNETHVLRIIPV